MGFYQDDEQEEKGKGPIMYCSRSLDSVEQILFSTSMEVRKATSKNGVKAVRQESCSDTIDSKPV